MLKNPLTYEIMTPDSVGLKNTNLVLGKHSGRAAFQDRMQELGFELYVYTSVANNLVSSWAIAHLN